MAKLLVYLWKNFFSILPHLFFFFGNLLIIWVISKKNKLKLKTNNVSVIIKVHYSNSFKNYNYFLFVKLLNLFTFTYYTAYL